MFTTTSNQITLYVLYTPAKGEFNTNKDEELH